MNQHQQRAAGRRSWGSSVRAAVYAPHSIIDHQNRNRGHYRARVIFLARPCHASVLHLPRHRASAFYTICRGDLQARQRRTAIPSLWQSANPICRCRLARGPQFRFSQHLVCQDTYAAEAHLERLSMRAGFYVQQHSERHIPHVRESVGEFRND
jgi:hypothetical protein